MKKIKYKLIVLLCTLSLCISCSTFKNVAFKEVEEKKKGNEKYSFFFDFLLSSEDTNSYFGLPSAFGREVGAEFKAGSTLNEHVELYGTLKAARNVPFRNENIFNEIPKSYLFSLGVGGAWRINNLALSGDVDFSLVNFSLDKVDLYSMIGVKLTPTYRLPLSDKFSILIGMPVSYSFCTAGNVLSYGLAFCFGMGKR